MVHSSKKAIPTKISSLNDAISIQILVHKSLTNPWWSRQPTQFQAPQFSIFGQPIFALPPPQDDIGIKRCGIFLGIFWSIWNAESCPLPKRPRKNFKMVSRFSLPRKLVRVWYQIKWFFKRYNLSYSDSSFIPWGRKALKSRNSTYSPVFFYLQRHNTVFMTKNNLFSS